MFPSYLLDMIFENNCHDIYKCSYPYLESKEQYQLRDKQNRNKQLRDRIQRVKFDDPWTIVWWNDGTITRVKCSDLDNFSEESGLMAAICKHYYEDTNIFSEMLHKWCKPTSDNPTYNDIDMTYRIAHKDGYEEGFKDSEDEYNSTCHGK